MMSNGESWSSETLMTIDDIAAHFSTFCFARICLTSEAVSELKTAWGKDNARNQLHWKQTTRSPPNPQYDLDTIIQSSIKNNTHKGIFSLADFFFPPPPIYIKV